MLKSDFWLKSAALLVACFLWFQSVLLKEHQTIVKLPLEVINKSEQINLVDLPTTVEYKVKGAGFEILKLKLLRVSVQLDAKELRAGKNNLSTVNYRLTLPPSIHLELLEAVANESSSIQTEYSRVVLLPVHLEFENPESRSQFYKKNYRVFPEKVEVRGTANALNKLIAISTQAIESNSLNSPISKIMLIVPESVVISPSVVEIRQSDTNYITRVMWKIPIQNEFGGIVFPITITVRVRGTVKAINDLTPQDISVKLSGESSKDGSMPLIVSVPKGIELIDYTPKTVNKGY